MKTFKGFTLIEMLIVITIIGVIAFLGISTYGDAQRQAKLEFAADTVVSLIRQQQSLVKSGRIVVNNQESDATDASNKKCYGLLITSQTVSLVESSYFAIKDNIADVCDVTTLKERPVNDLKDFTISTLERSGEPQEELLILFKPPAGKTLLGTKTEVFSPQTDITPDIIIGITAQQGNEERLIRFSPSTGFVERIKAE